MYKCFLCHQEKAVWVRDENFYHLYPDADFDEEEIYDKDLKIVSMFKCTNCDATYEVTYVDDEECDYCPW